jgi:hypothetical protein
VTQLLVDVSILLLDCLLQRFNQEGLLVLGLLGCSQFLSQLIFLSLHIVDCIDTGLLDLRLLFPVLNVDADFIVVLLAFRKGLIHEGDLCLRSVQLFVA